MKIHGVGSRQLQLPLNERLQTGVALPLDAAAATPAAARRTEGGTFGEPYLTITILAARLGVSYRVALEAANSGQMPTYRFGNSRRRGLESEWRALIHQMRGDPR